MQGDDSTTASALPSLPGDCPELERTARPDRGQPLAEYLDAVPILDREQFVRLTQVATVPHHAEPDAGLGLADLLRRREDDSHSLHPRVLQVLPPTAVESTLTDVVAHVDEHISYPAYQHPEYLLASRIETTREPVLCPPAHNMHALDVVRDLRANDVVTVVRRPGQGLPARATLERTLARMERLREPVEGVVTLLPPVDTPHARSMVLVESRERASGRRSTTEITDLCDTLKRRFAARLTISTTTEYASANDG